MTGKKSGANAQQEIITLNAISALQKAAIEEQNTLVQVRIKRAFEQS